VSGDRISGKLRAETLAPSPEAGAQGSGFTMVTCDPNEIVAPIHPKATITILHEKDWDRWMTCSYDEVVQLQRPYPAELMTVRGPEFPTRASKT
jgi:putative SOS response-associated peptidase YedK